MTAALAWGDPQTIALSDVRPGDFLVAVPAQGGLPELDVRSTVTAAGLDFDHGWRKPSGLRRPRYFGVPGVAIAVVTGPAVYRPAECTATVRRPEGGA